jgi:Flp pilus assembly protein TadD
VNIADPPVRIALAVVALAVAALLTLELYADKRVEAGRGPAFEARGRALPPKLAEQVLADLRAGGRFRPGTDALLTEALVELRAGRAGEAERDARRALEREPRNHQAWSALGASLSRRDPPAARRAARRARELNPRGP